MYKTIIAGLFICMAYVAGAQSIQIKTGTKLVYNVEETGRKYQYTVLVKELTDSTMQLQWQVSGPVAYKGKCINEGFDKAETYILMAKPNYETEEHLDEASLRLLAPAYMCEDLWKGAASLEYTVDQFDAVLTRHFTGSKVKYIYYNNQKRSYEGMEYKDANIGVSLAFVPFGVKQYCVCYYSDENFSMDLVDIQTPE